MFCGLGVAQHMNAPSAPCQKAAVEANTTNCFYTAAKKADADLNRTYGKIRAALKNSGVDTDLQNLINAKRFWLQFRDVSCKAERALYEGGTAAPTAHDACIEELTRKRTEDLKATYNWIVINFGTENENGGK
jgi:uncharacterized protein YecT (DUF1311 family)